ncbi:unnamed protein product [Microthlaspi erraticum]|uniref:Uncharacterized protein n=1 Tax=Microthlaspi erraticum TaxID=1685480 RepID=A0A6D2K967_9BRAS|nr:unnamed protein product [Microthlaspi erraticum]
MEEKAAASTSRNPDPNQVNEAPPLAQEALPQNAPSVLELRHQLDHFTSSLNRISMRSDYLLRLYERLRVNESTPRKTPENSRGDAHNFCLTRAGKSKFRKKGGRRLSKLHAGMGSAARLAVFRRNAIDFRRTIMRRTTDPLTIY